MPILGYYTHIGPQRALPITKLMWPPDNNPQFWLQILSEADGMARPGPPYIACMVLRSFGPGRGRPLNSPAGREINHGYNSAFLAPPGSFMSPANLVVERGVVPCPKPKKLLGDMFGSRASSAGLSQRKFIALR